MSIYDIGLNFRSKLNEQAWLIEQMHSNPNSAAMTRLQALHHELKDLNEIICTAFKNKEYNQVVTFYDTTNQFKRLNQHSEKLIKLFSHNLHPLKKQKTDLKYFSWIPSAVTQNQVLSFLTLPELAKTLVVSPEFKKMGDSFIKSNKDKFAEQYCRHMILSIKKCVKYADHYQASEVRSLLYLLDTHLSNWTNMHYDSPDLTSLFAMADSPFDFPLEILQHEVVRFSNAIQEQNCFHYHANHPDRAKLLAKHPDRAGLLTDHPDRVRLLAEITSRCIHLLLTGTINTQAFQQQIDTLEDNIPSHKVAFVEPLFACFREAITLSTELDVYYCGGKGLGLPGCIPRLYANNQQALALSICRLDDGEETYWPFTTDQAIAEFIQQKFYELDLKTQFLQTLEVSTALDSEPRLMFFKNLNQFTTLEKCVVALVTIDQLSKFGEEIVVSDFFFNICQTAFKANNFEKGIKFLTFIKTTEDLNLIEDVLRHTITSLADKLEFQNDQEQLENKKMIETLVMHLSLISNRKLGKESDLEDEAGLKDEVDVVDSLVEQEPPIVLEEVAGLDQDPNNVDQYFS